MKDSEKVAPEVRENQKSTVSQKFKGRNNYKKGKLDWSIAAWRQAEETKNWEGTIGCHM